MNVSVVHHKLQGVIGSLLFVPNYYISDPIEHDMHVCLVLKMVLSHVCLHQSCHDRQCFWSDRASKDGIILAESGSIK